jgi:hypothetical protein
MGYGFTRRNKSSARQTILKCVGQAWGVSPVV